MALLDFFNKRKKGDDKAEMSFIDHLEDLRWHVIRSVIAVLIGAVLVFSFIRDIVTNIIFAPTRADFISSKWLCSLGHKIGIGETLCFPEVNAKFLETTMTGQFISSFTLAFVGGFIIAFPYIFWEFWRFVKPALSPKELKQTRGVIFWVSLLFFAGVLFGYLILTPFMVNFYFNYKLSDQITIMPSFSDYLENLIYTTVGIGVLFQMPLLVMVLARIGIVKATFLKKYRRHAFVIILIAAAIITPSTDPFSLTIVTIPLYLLFEASIIIASRINKRQEKEQKEWS
ncbi:MAG: twin-arginine translocase subunit TatC [Chitinophagaceae bacterium]|nr:twin-arginine translocase subunit TatC [Chitinophagaceae bacterium]MBK7680040.1 twin-arginine translocase subunit TatC [Chitinophagaceae bacterium]MBK9465722.1 twin-arginine translocase subunit TatC [Chitinophagaceae bacterium]MBK9937748.1 twin-arginine translocase subunit TatC [Chitinophagaceae bacterium]MBL0068786.1 twin-arginine translocase subunit TatC [Chitinophagaceae bacterium]